MPDQGFPALFDSRGSFWAGLIFIIATNYLLDKHHHCFWDFLKINVNGFCSKLSLITFSSSKLWFAKFEGLCSLKWLVHQWAEVWPVAARKKRGWQMQWWIRSEWDVEYEPFMVRIPSWYWLEELEFQGKIFYIW